MLADNKNARGPQDSSRIAMDEDYEVQYWTGKFSVSREQLQKAVTRSGVAQMRSSGI